MPLLFDMSLEECLHYEGTNPCPSDFESFWNDGVAEMHKLGTTAELVSAPFDTPFAECFDLYFTGVGGSRIHAKLLRPKKQADPGPAVLQFHGYTGSSGCWSEKLNFVAAGYTVAALDCRGQGGLSQDLGGTSGNTMSGQIIRGLDDTPDKLLFRQIFLDTAQLARIVMAMPNVDEKRVGVMGGSQGGGLTLACAALEPSVALAAPVYPFLTDYYRTWKIDLAVNAYDELKRYFRHFDPCHERELEIFTKLGYIDIQYLTPRIRATTLMGVGLMDTICPPSTQFAAYNKIKSDKSYVLYPDFGHEELSGHNDRIYSFMMGL